MIVFDKPRPTTFRHFRRTSHCASTLPGEAGTLELLEFGRRIGLMEEWLQHRGAYREHFDLFDGKIDAARRTGAREVGPREFVLLVLAPKRFALEAAP